MTRHPCDETLTANGGGEIKRKHENSFLGTYVVQKQTRAKPASIKRGDDAHTCMCLYVTKSTLQGHMGSERRGYL